MKTSSPLPPFFLIVLSLFLLVSSYVHSQTIDSCNSPPTLTSPPPFNITPLACASVWAPHNFILRYGQASPGVWSFVLSAPNTNAYIGIGFSSNGDMIGSRAVVGWVGANGITQSRKYLLGGKQANLVTIEASNQNLQVVNSSITVQSNNIYMAFQVIIDRPTTRLLYAIGPRGRIPSAQTSQLFEHDDMTATIIDYSTGQFDAISRPQANLRRTHGILNMLGWAIMLPIGAMVARYMRNWDPIWFYSHAVIQSSGFILGLTGVICGLVLENRTDASVSRHKGIGITVLILGCLQVIAILARPNKEAKIRKYWNWYHFGVGRVLIFLAAVNVFYGIHLGNAGSGWNVGFAVVLVILFIISLIFELRMCFKK